MGSNVSTVELLGLFFSVVAWLCTLSSTLMPSWLNLNTDLLPSENFYLGLWGTCVIQDMGDGNECRLYDNMLALPLDVMLARILMCVALGLGVSGLLLTIPGLHQVKCCYDRTKKVLRMAGGVLSLLNGVLVLIPVSYMAHLTVIKFFDETLPDIYERWEFGEALFCGWAAGFLYLVAGTLLLISCLSQKQENHNLPAAEPMMEPTFAASRSQYI